MIFLFEQFSYSLDYLKKVLPTDSVGRFKGLPNGFVGRDCKLDGVGYFYNKSAKKSVDNAAKNIVFVLPKVFMDEAMIDKLVGDELPKQMEYLKSQKDGKEVDHLYKDRQLIFADEDQKIWFIGDSKYYKDGKDIEGTSVYKQFTYARNIIQYNIKDLLSKGSGNTLMRYRDELTEGYSITPNFFIRGEIPDYKEEGQFQEPYFREKPDPKNKDLIKKDDADLWEERNRHFTNRLFDRDTLLLQVYNVNFLYVLKAFTSKRSSLREEFKRTAREKFRKNFMTLLNEKYYFWALFPQPQDVETISKFVDDNFKKLVGRVFRPDDLSSYLILALEKNSVKDSDKDYREIYDAVNTAVAKREMEIFNVKPQDLWSDGKILEDYLKDKSKSGWGNKDPR